MRFTKMEGLGNDYIYFNCLENVPENLPQLAVRLSDRHFGIGADGIICIRQGRGGDFSMEMYNADGSRGAMCGNGIRCVGKYVYDKGLTRKTCLTIDTDAGPKALELHVLGSRVDTVTVNMGEVRAFAPVTLEPSRRASTLGPHRFSIRAAWNTAQAPVPQARVTPLPRSHTRRTMCSRSGQAENSMFRRTPKAGWVSRRGPSRSRSTSSGAEQNMTPWGLPASAGTTVKHASPKVEARLDGGLLTLEKCGDSVLMTGPARTVFEGELP